MSALQIYLDGDNDEDFATTNDDLLEHPQGNVAIRARLSKYKAIEEVASDQQVNI
jgi:hypothetical protein